MIYAAPLIIRVLSCLTINFFSTRDTSSGAHYMCDRRNQMLASPATWRS